MGCFRSLCHYLRLAACRRERFCLQKHVTYLCYRAEFQVNHPILTQKTSINRVTDFLSDRLLGFWLCAFSRRDDCIKRTFGPAYHAAVTAMYVYKGRLITVNSDNGSDLTHLLRQTTPTRVAAVIINLKRSIAERGTYQRSYSFDLVRCTSA
jgi:hypothetical protein